jgi:nucleotide-binding universal stress UspA family protein
MPSTVQLSEVSVERSPVIACIGSSMHAGAVAQASARLAAQARKPLILFHSISEPRINGNLPDPFSCQIDRRRMGATLAELSQMLDAVENGISVTLGEGHWQSELSQMVARTGPTIAVAGSPRSGHTSHLATSILEQGITACMFVPQREPIVDAAQTRPKIMVPLDGSAFSEAALAQAIRLATSDGAELFLAHVVPECGLEDFGPPTVQDLQLRDQIDRRNEQSACEFLEAHLRQIHAYGLAARSNCMKGDPRVRLLDLVAEEQPAMVVMSARGAGLRTCEDLAIGSTTAFLLDHLSVPVLVVASAPLAPPGARWAGNHALSEHLARAPLSRPVLTTS